MFRSAKRGKTHLATTYYSKMASASSGGPAPAPGAVADAPSSYELFYSSATLQTYTADQLWAVFGINIATIDIEILNYQSFYPVVETPITANNYLYTASPVYTIDGEIANQTWVYTARPLPKAKDNGQSLVKATAKQEAEDINATYGLNAFSFAGIASQTVPPTRYQGVLDSVTAITDRLDADLTSIEAATTVDEINNIVNPPTGILSTGRGSGDGPLDLNISFYTEFNSVSLTEAETELYIPGTSTVITYGKFAPDVFDSAGNCFTTGNYLVQIREVATSRVFAEFVCPLSPTNVDVPF
jgi:hypothetical protein